MPRLSCPIKTLALAFGTQMGSPFKFTTQTCLPTWSSCFSHSSWDSDAFVFAGREGDEWEGGGGWGASGLGQETARPWVEPALAAAV